MRRILIAVTSLLPLAACGPGHTTPYEPNAGTVSKVESIDNPAAWRAMAKTNVTAFPKSYSGDGEWTNVDRPPTHEEGYAALGLLLGPDLWVSSPLIGNPFAVPFAAYPEGPRPGVVEGALIDGELYWARLPKGMASNAKEMCTADPKERIGEEVEFLFTRGMNLGYRVGKIETVISDAEGRNYLLIDTEKVTESIGSPVFTADMCVVGFIGDSQLQKGLTNVVARSITDIMQVIDKAGGKS
jgi:hypothetical protein